MSNDKSTNRQADKPVKKVSFFEAKQHIEIIRQVKGEIAYIPREQTPPKRPRKNG